MNLSFQQQSLPVFVVPVIQHHCVHQGKFSACHEILCLNEQIHPVHDITSHMQNVGKMVDNMEIKMCNLLRVMW